MIYLSIPQVRKKPKKCSRSPTVCADSEIITCWQNVVPPHHSLYLAEVVSSRSRLYRDRECTVHQHLCSTVRGVEAAQN